MREIKRDNFLTYNVKDSSFEELNKNTWQSFIHFDFEKYIIVRCYEHDLYIDFNTLDYNNPKVYDYLINNDCIFVTSEKEKEYLRIMKPDNIFKLSICLALCNPHPSCIDAFNGIVQNIPNNLPELLYKATKDTLGYFVFEEQQSNTKFNICILCDREEEKEGVSIDFTEPYEKFCYYMNKSERIPNLSDLELRKIFNDIHHKSCISQCCAKKYAQNTYKAAYVDWLIENKK